MAIIPYDTAAEGTYETWEGEEVNWLVSVDPSDISGEGEPIEPQVTLNLSGEALHYIASNGQLTVKAPLSFFEALVASAPQIREAIAKAEVERPNYIEDDD